MYSLTKIITLLVFVADLVAARRICPNVPQVCNVKCIKYGWDDVTKCSTCDCVKPNYDLDDDKFEGDIYLEDRTESALLRSLNSNKKGTSGDIIPKWFVYQDGDTWQIPYEIYNDGTASYASTAIRDAIADFHANSCIRFVERTTQQNYISFFDGGYGSCWSYVGVRAPGTPNWISIGQGCNTKGIVIHEILHALGFWHEQSRPDRDDYIIIKWKNIYEDKKHNFQKRLTIDSLGVEYDTRSVMHYPNWAFSNNSKDTIVNKDGSKFTNYQREGFVESDIKQLNLLYRCGSTPTVNPTPETTAVSQGTTAVTQTTAAPCADMIKAKKCRKAVKKGKCGKRKVKQQCALSCGVCEP